MGRYLFLRVAAQTFDEQQVRKAWPGLYALAWSDEYSLAAPEKAIVKNFTPPSPRGVLELLRAVADAVTFGVDLPADAKRALAGPVARATALADALDEATGNRDVPTAHELTNSIEDALDNLEAVLADLDLD